MSPDTWGLRPLERGDVDAVHAVYGDPATWEHLPEGVHATREESERLIERAVAGWRDVGLGEWAVLVRDELVGVGGVSPRGRYWNLGFRLAPSVWGHGLATWVADVALGAAHRTRPEWPVVARSLVRNPASGRVSENAGLALLHHTRRPDGLELLVHADRVLEDDVLAAVLALG